MPTFPSCKWRLDVWLLAFDRVVSANWRITTAPQVDIVALGALESLRGKDISLMKWAQHWDLATQSGEMSMPRKLTTYQFDLFAKPNDAEMLTPQW